MASRKTKISWTSEMEEQLVELWEQRECLYNISSKTYHNRTDKERSWTEIATAVDVPVEEVKTRATTLRTQYSKLLKSKPSGIGGKPLTSRQKWLLRALMFLKQYVIQRPAESSLHQSVKEALTAEDLTTDQDDESGPFEDFTAGGTSSNPTNSSPNDDDDDDDDNDNEESVIPSSLTKKRRKSQPRDSIECQKLKILQQMSDAVLAGRSRAVSDGDATFGAQVAEELRAIKNPALKIRVKRKIMNDLYEAQECDTQNLLPPPFHPPSVKMPHIKSSPEYPQPLPEHQYQNNNNNRGSLETEQQDSQPLHIKVEEVWTLGSTKTRFNE